MQSKAGGSCLQGKNPFREGRALFRGRLSGVLQHVYELCVTRQGGVQINTQGAKILLSFPEVSSEVCTTGGYLNLSYFLHLDTCVTEENLAARAVRLSATESQAIRRKSKEREQKGGKHASSGRNLPSTKDAFFPNIGETVITKYSLIQSTRSSETHWLQGDVD